MSICAHPSIENTQRYRVYSRKIVGLTKDFSIAKLGKKKAFKSASHYNHTVVERREKILSHIENLDHNKIFCDDGKVRGLKTIFRELVGGEKVKVLFFQKRINGGNLARRQVAVNQSRPFEDAYREMQREILALYGIKLSIELTAMFKNAKKYYW
jgi:hypothetical protein